MAQHARVSLMFESKWQRNEDDDLCIARTAGNYLSQDNLATLE